MKLSTLKTAMGEAGGGEEYEREVEDAEEEGQEDIDGAFETFVDSSQDKQTRIAAFRRLVKSCS